MHTELPSWLRDHWSEVEHVAGTLAYRPDSTIERAQTATASLPTFGGLERALVLGDVLAEGGMGVVHNGRQVVLDRAVAVKAVKEARRGPRSTRKLLQEAWATGQLDHPNVVPVHDIALSDEGEPLIVMKRIEGDPWSALLAQPELVRERFGAEDPLDWNLRVLLQVCNAIAFAHSRGLVHLDLKPSNVMVGAFGEVYVVDWGLAMSVDSEDGRLPCTTDCDEIIGTPSYLAPEMLASDGALLTERTDVYLLGATLYELLEHRPPHRGDNVIAIFFSAATRDPELAEDTPAELAALVRRAMAREPEQRFESVGDFRRAVQGFLQHRGSLRLSDGASAQLGELRSAIDRGEDAATVHGLGTAARFGFGQALVAWSGNVAARAGLRESTQLMARDALGRGDVSAASGLAAELDPADPELLEDIAEARRGLEAEAQRVQRLERLDADMDLRTGQRTRVFITGIFGLLWALGPLPAAILGPEVMPMSWERLFVSNGVFLLLVICLTTWARESMTKTLINRRAAGTFLILLLCQMLVMLPSMRSGVDPDAVVSILLGYWTAIAAMFALTIEPRCWPMALLYVPCTLVATFVPRAAWWMVSLANTGFLVNVVLVWRPDQMRFIPDRDPAQGD